MAKDKMKVTPYEVEGKIDYDKLIKKFGVKKLNKKLLERIKKHTKELHIFLRRKVFFAHRDLKWLLDEYEKGNKFFLYTGRAPSGPVHLGHLMPWIFCKWLQDKFGVEMWFQFPNEEKFLFNKDMDFETVQEYLNENMLDVIALGFDPKKTNFLIDTKHADLMYREACKVAKKITLSTVKASFGFTDSNNIGSIFYTAMQAVPAFLPSIIRNKKMPCLIPLGIDQDTHFRLSRDVMPKLGYYKPAIMHCRFLLGLLEGGKMSSSQKKSAIYTTDKPNTVKKKINNAFSGGAGSLKEHREKGGNPDIDIACQYLYYFFEPDDKKIKEIFDGYRDGSITTGDVKSLLIKKINKFLKKHQKERKRAKKKVDDFVFEG